MPIVLYKLYSFNIIPLFIILYYPWRVYQAIILSLKVIAISYY